MIALNVVSAGKDAPLPVSVIAVVKQTAGDGEASEIEGAGSIDRIFSCSAPGRETANSHRVRVHQLM